MSEVGKLIAANGEVKVGSDVIGGLEMRLSVIQALIPVGGGAGRVRCI